jgi:predicted transcriptional regulator
MSASMQIRLPDSLKERVQTYSKKDGVSMNQLILLATSEYVARLEMTDNRKNGISDLKIEELLSKIPSIPVTDPNDKLPEDWNITEFDKVK